MPRYQLPIAIALVGLSIGSLITFYFTQPNHGKIRLPLHLDDTASESLPATDPFDVTTPEDIIDGYPIEAEKFWARMRWRKLFIALLLSAIVSINAILLGLGLVANGTVSELLTYGMHTGVSMYLLVLAVRSIPQEEIEKHSESVLHLAVLSTSAAFLLGSAAILPDTPSPIVASTESSSPSYVLWLTNLALYTIICLVTMTTARGPPLWYPPERIYSEKTISATTNTDHENVCGITVASPWDTLLFSYTTKVVWLGNLASSLEIGDLPIVPGEMRATFNYASMKRAMREIHLCIGSWSPRPGSGWGLGYRLLRLNILLFTAELFLAVIVAFLFYVPAIFLRAFVAYLEVDTKREDTGWGWVYVVGLFGTTAITYLITNQLWSLSTTTIQLQLRIQLNTTLFAKTLVRKDVASSAAPPVRTAPGETPESPNASQESESEGKEDDFSSKAQIMTLMTTDASEALACVTCHHIWYYADSPIEIAIGTIFLYRLLGVSCFFGLAVACLLLPMNHFAGKIAMGAQENLMKARDERVSLMNELLGGIRMLKFMAWERSFEAKVLRIRGKELKYQRLNYIIETLWTCIWHASPIFVTVVSFWHFTVVRNQVLTPSIAFTSIIVFTEMKFALSALPETFINILQSLVSLRRIEKYLNGAEVKPVPPMDQQSKVVAFQSCTVTWPQDRSLSSVNPSAESTPRNKFILVDLNLNFPPGELSLICGRLGSGKTLLLLALLGEADLLAGQMLCPRSPPDSLASFATAVPKEEWIVSGICAYVPQAAWLRNASIKENILFNLPFDEERYQRTLEVCALVSDLEILEDGDESEIGERGVNLSGGQKARVSLARAVYSRASLLLLDDVLSAVDAHTAHHIYHQCLTGDLMRGRTVILVSHHVQLCTPGAAYVVALDNGRVQFAGNKDDFRSSGTLSQLGQSSDPDVKTEVQVVPENEVDQIPSDSLGPNSETSSTVAPSEMKANRKPPRKLVEEEKRAVGRISRDIWLTYIHACGVLASIAPVLENNWIRYWSSISLESDRESPAFYIAVYAIITSIGLIFATIRFFILYSGSIHASTVLYKSLLEAVLFANIRFHDTVSRGRLLNRFGKDFEGIDSRLPDNFGRSIMYGLSALTTITTISVVGGAPFVIAVLILGALYYNVAKTSRDMRRLDSVTRSPLYSIYGETISGVTILRAFGASSKFLRDMLRCVDTNSSPCYWMWGVNRWLSSRFNLLSSAILGATALVALLTPRISASLAGFALAFASTITNDLLFMVRRFVGLEQSMVALERVKEYSELAREPPEFTEIGILGRTGSGKSTLALSFFRFVEATEGRISVDDIDIAKIGLTDLRSKLTIIPQDPTILSGSLRSTLDVFEEYGDAEIYEALRRVHLIPPEGTAAEAGDTVNANVFRDLDSPVSEGGENFSTGEKQLLCMARAVLKRSRVLIMDEATASVDYATDELISKTIRQEFAASTILTIAHRLRTVIDYDRVMLLDQGRIIELDKPGVLLSDTTSKFYGLCQATGKDEFAMLKKLAGVSAA
ncbi:multidrug resistance-associated ABC transporter [Infundibulicybe gibba]|nr:multidrug resistance-associated ABC transporter [Infundibulicybe gibba]